MISFILSCASWEQVKRFWVAKVTLGKLLAYSSTSPTFTTLEMFIPQLQTKTPIRVCCPATSISSGFSTLRVRELRASAKQEPAAQAAALASITELGMSLGSWNTPQA